MRTFTFAYTGLLAIIQMVWTLAFVVLAVLGIAAGSLPMCYQSSDAFYIGLGCLALAVVTGLGSFSTVKVSQKIGHGSGAATALDIIGAVSFFVALVAYVISAIATVAWLFSSGYSDAEMTRLASGALICLGVGLLSTGVGAFCYRNG